MGVVGEVMIEQLSKYKDLFYYIPAAVPSAVAALEMAAEIRGNYEYGGLIWLQWWGYFCLSCL